MKTLYIIIASVLLCGCCHTDPYPHDGELTPAQASESADTIIRLQKQIAENSTKSQAAFVAKYTNEIGDHIELWLDVDGALWAFISDKNNDFKRSVMLLTTTTLRATPESHAGNEWSAQDFAR